MVSEVIVAARPDQPARQALLVGGGLLLLILVWGTSFLAIKVALGSFPPLFLAGARMAVATPILLGFTATRGYPIAKRWTDAAFFMGVGLLASGITPALAFWGQKSLSIGLGSILFASSPLFVVILARWFLPFERFTGWRLVGVAIGLVGVIVVTGGSVRSDDVAHLPQILAQLAGSLTWAIGLILMKRFSRPYAPVPTVALQSAAGALVLLPASLLVFEPTQPISLTPMSIALFVYMTVAMTCASQSLYLWLVPRVPATTLSYVSCAVPVIAVIAGAVVLNEHVGLAVLGGGALVVAGLVLVNTRSA